MTRKRTRRTMHPLINPIEMAVHRVAKLSPAQRVELLAAGRHALEALGRGQGSVATWQQFADVLNIAEALAELQIAGNLASTIAHAQSALAALMDRVRAGRGWTLYAAELTALREGHWLYGVQLDHCSAGEHLRAIEVVRRRISGALAGNASPRTRVHNADGVRS